MTVLDERLTPTSLGGLKIVSAGNQEPNINMLIFGPYGIGKTLLAGSSDAVPEMRKVLHIDIEGGTLTLRHTFPNVETVRVTDWPQLNSVYNELRAGLHKEFRTIIVDSLTEAQAFNLDKILITELQEQIEAGEELKRDEDIANMRQWQKNQSQIKKFIRAYRDLPVSVIFTALEKDDKDKTTGRVRTLPDLPGKLARQVPAMFDEVFYYFPYKQEADGETKEIRVLQSQGTARVAAKDRSGKMPALMPNPDMKKIYAKIMNKEEKTGE